MHRNERASGLLPTVFGLAVLLAMITLASSVAIGLWERTGVESIAYEAAIEVATADPAMATADVRSRAISRACDRLGTRCSEVRMTFVDTNNAPMVELRVEAPGRGLLPRFLAGHGPVVGELDRRIRIHKERP
ncbi:MAG: hypothetical protein ACK5O2_13465 [Microthrixaceae bacterium]